jgi:RNA polymerase sigma factor (sigma-70 family)
MSNRDEVIDTVAEEVGVDRADVEDMDRHLSAGDASLDKPLAETGTALVELMPADSPTQEELLGDLEAEADRAARLNSALETLDPREREIIEKRYLSENQVQLKEIGEHMGVTKQRIAQLERRALKKLRAKLLKLRKNRSHPPLTIAPLFSVKVGKNSQNRVDWSVLPAHYFESICEVINGRSPPGTVRIEHIFSHARDWARRF